MKLVEYSRPMMWAGVGVIGVTGLFAAVFLLIGKFGALEGKLLATTFTIGFYSLMSAATFGEGKVFAFMATFGAAVALLGLAVGLSAIWVDDWWMKDDTWKAALTIGTLAFALAHMATNYRLSGNSAFSTLVMVSANLFVGVVTVMLVVLIVTEGRDVGDLFFRLLAFFAVLNVTLSTINPAAARLSRSPARQ